MTTLVQDPVLLNDWHPVALAASIAPGAIVATELLDTRVALWRDSGGVLHAWEDRCPHRGTRLSMGALDGDTLRCAYHGWAFGKEGRCQHIPALPALAPANLKAQVSTYAVRECYGLAWVCLGLSAGVAEGMPASAPPRFPEHADSALRKVTCGPYDVASSAPRIIENFLDMAHFAFVHEGILGQRDQAAIADYTVDSFDDADHGGKYGAGVWARQCRAFQPQASKAALAGSDIEYSYRVVRPLTAILTKQASGARKEAIALLLQPLTETTTRAWIILALDDFSASDDALRQFQDTIFLQGLPILESQSPRRLPLIPGAEVSVACDRMSLAYRAYLKRSGLRYGVLTAQPQD